MCFKKLSLAGVHGPYKFQMSVSVKLEIYKAPKTEFHELRQ